MVIYPETMDSYWNVHFMTISDIIINVPIHVCQAES